MEEEMLPEYDFKSMKVHKMGSGRKSFYGIPNPDYVGHANVSAEVEAHTPNVTLEPDVAAVFGTAEAVNEALRFLIKITRDNAPSLARAK